VAITYSRAGTAERCRNVAGGKREARNPRSRRSPNPRTPQACEETRGNGDRGYRSLYSLNPRLHSLHRSAVPAARIRDRNYETTY